jgi:hypothetical protein
MKRAVLVREPVPSSFERSAYSPGGWGASRGRNQHAPARTCARVRWAADVWVSLGSRPRSITCVREGRGSVHPRARLAPPLRTRRTGGKATDLSSIEAGPAPRSHWREAGARATFALSDCRGACRLTGEGSCSRPGRVEATPMLGLGLTGGAPGGASLTRSFAGGSLGQAVYA